MEENHVIVSSSPAKEESKKSPEKELMENQASQAKPEVAEKRVSGENDDSDSSSGLSSSSDSEELAKKPTVSAEPGKLDERKALMEKLARMKQLLKQKKIS